MRSLELLHQLLHEIPHQLEKVPDPGRRPAPDKWSPKEELGHLLDSAANNHQRIVRGQLEERPAYMPTRNAIGVNWCSFGWA
jgi:hypothetical protein